MTFLQLLSKLCHCSWVGMKLLFPGNLYLVTNISHIKTVLLIYAVAPIFDFVILVENVHVVIVYDCLHVLLAAVTHFNFISAEYLIKDVVFWEIGS